MLKKVTIENFFAYQTPTTIELNPGVNLLLGINGSGKTCFINALRLLYEGVVGKGLKNLIDDTWGGVKNVINISKEGTGKNYFKLTYVFSAEQVEKKLHANFFKKNFAYVVKVKVKQDFDYSVEEYFMNTDDFSSEKPYYFINNVDGNGTLTVRDRSNKKIISEKYCGDIKDKELIAHIPLDSRRYQPVFLLRKIVSEFSIYNYFNGDKVKNLVPHLSETRLLSDGSNLPYLLNYLKNNNDDVFIKIENILNNVNSQYSHINFNYFASSLYLTLEEKGLNKNIGAKFLSDGTIQFLLMLSVFYNPERGAVVAVDEPERGLHPDMIKSVSEMIKSAAKNSQIIVATHSPLLLNQFDLEDIIVFEKNIHNVASVRKYTEDEFSDDDDFLPGQLWLLGKIGGKRW